jgi:hypothetical protein
MTDSLQSWNSMHALSERILRTDSATDELERWCRDNVIGDGQIVALCDRDARPEALDDESLEALYPHPGRDKTMFRKVRLATAGIAVVDALNWFFPDNLSRDIREQLETSDIPFGRAIRHLNPKRRTFLVRRCTPAQLVDAARSIDSTAVALARSSYWRETIKMGGIVDRWNLYPGARDVDLIGAARGLREPPVGEGGQPIERRFGMKILIISAIAAVALFAAVNGVLRSHSLSTIGSAGKRSGSTVQDMQGDRSIDQLPVEDFEDRSLVFPREARR